MEKNKMFEKLICDVCSMGATGATVIDADKIELDASFRDMCASNACGVYGKCWMCPPDIGDIHALMNVIRTYKHVFVFQTIGTLEDSFDIEGMHEAGSKHNKLAQKLREVFAATEAKDVLHLGAGGCRVCKVCAKRTNEPCRFPHLAMSSLEAYGINVSKMASAAGMKYINGVNTVTFFGAVFFNL